MVPMPSTTRDSTSDKVKKLTIVKPSKSEQAYRKEFPSSAGQYDEGRSA